MQPVKAVAHQWRKYTIFSLNAENDNTNRTNYKDLGMNGATRPTSAEEYPQRQLLGEPKATRVLLKFLVNTNVALP